MYLEEKRKATTKTNYKIVSITLKRSSPSAMTYLAEKHHLLYQTQTPNKELADRLSTYFRTKIEKKSGTKLTSESTSSRKMEFRNLKRK